MAVGIVTDSSCDLHDDELSGLGVEVVPLFIRFGIDEYVDREQIAVEDFYTRMASSAELPQTAAPAPGRFEQAFRRHLDAGCEAVVSINLSSAMSATMQSAVQAADAVPEPKPEPRRHKGAGQPFRDRGPRHAGAAAAARAAEGADADEIEALVADASHRTHALGRSTRWRTCARADGSAVPKRCSARCCQSSRSSILEREVTEAAKVRNAPQGVGLAVRPCPRGCARRPSRGDARPGPRR